MSTRAQIKIKDNYEEFWFYRHSDGYPEGTLPTLEKFLKWIKEGKIRDNPGQAASWLIMIGAQEYCYAWGDKGKVNLPLENAFEPGKDEIMGWKVGAYEPSIPNFHGDIEYFYEINLTQRTITVFSVNYPGNYKNLPELKRIKVIK